MPLLDIALAFALTMLVVATVVTQIVRLFQYIFKLRRKELKKMLEEYFQEEFKPVVNRELSRLKMEATEDVYKKLSKVNMNIELSTLISDKELKALVEVSTEDLTEKLKRSSWGRDMLEKLGNQANDVFDELGRRYEVLGDKFTASFRKNSRWWATGVAFILACVVNIDSIHILDSYIKNEGMRQHVIEQRDSFVKDYNELIETLEDEEGKDSVTKKQLEAAFKDSKEKISSFADAGFPIGWSYFPHSEYVNHGSDDSQTSTIKKEESNDSKNSNKTVRWLMWSLGILLTAFLAGLGGPFWHDTVTGISRVVQRARIAKKPGGTK